MSSYDYLMKDGKTVPISKSYSKNSRNKVLEKSEILQGYAFLISSIKEKIDDEMDEKSAIRATARELIEGGSVLVEFLTLHETEVMNMLGDCTKEEQLQG